MSQSEPFNLLTSLPTGLAADIVSEWVGKTKSAVRCDTAFCNRHLRFGWLQFLSSPEFSVNWDVENRMNYPSVAWAIARNVWLHTLVFDEQSSYELFQMYLITRGAGVQAIRLTAQTPRIRDEFLDLIVDCCPNIAYLRLQIRPRFTSLQKLFATCTKLQEFSCNYDGELREDDLHGLVCPNLRSVLIENCRNSEFIEVVAQMAVNLRSMTLVKCSITNSAESTCSALGSISASLLHLHVSDTPLDDAALVAIASKYTQLQSLCVSATGVTDTGVCHAVQYLPHLQSLDLSKTYASDTCLAAIAAHCAGTLTELRVLWCDGVSPTGINEIMQKCPHVTSIGYDWFGGDMFSSQPRVVDFTLCTQLTTLIINTKTYENIDTMHSIAAHCKKLKYFTFHVYNLKSPTIFDAVVRKCKQLSVLSVHVGGQSNKFVYPKDIQRWQEMRPGLVVKRDFKATYYTWNVNNLGV